MPANSKPDTAADGENLAIWPDGEYASLSEVYAGNYSWKSDDYEVVDLTNDARLKELGIDLENI